MLYSHFKSIIIITISAKKNFGRICVTFSTPRFWCHIHLPYFITLFRSKHAHTHTHTHTSTHTQTHTYIHTHIHIQHTHTFKPTKGRDPKADTLG